MLQLYITSTERTGYYFLYDPVKETHYEGCVVDPTDREFFPNEVWTDEWKQTQALNDAFMHLAAKRISRHDTFSSKILLDAPVQIFIHHPEVRKKFKAPWKYKSVWKQIASKRRTLKYFEPKERYHTMNMPKGMQEMFKQHLKDIDDYIETKEKEQAEEEALAEAFDDKW